MIWLVIALFVVLIFVLIVFVIQQRNNKRNLELLSQFKTKYLDLENSISDIKLENLESKLNPHLFKNILSSLQSHAYQTYFAIDKLANVLDYVIYESKNKRVSPKQEIEFALNLIEINKIKLSPLFELNVKLKIEEENPFYTSKTIAPLICIDLIENAFKHADIQSPDSFITIVIEQKSNWIAFTVSNKISEKPKLEKANSGFGSNSLAERLELVHKDAYKLERFIEGDTYFAQLKIIFHD
ncbi:MAG: histidine kinase [Fluviicola sp.]